MNCLGPIFYVVETIKIILMEAGGYPIWIYIVFANKNIFCFREEY